MEVEIKVIRTRTISLDNSKLETYAEEVRDRFEKEKDCPVNMIDLLYQAQLDGDISLPEVFDLEDYDNDLSYEEIKELAKS